MDTLTFSFEILISHKAATENYSGVSNFVFGEKYEYNDISFLGKDIKELKLNKTSDQKYKCLITFGQKLSEDQKKSFVEKFSFLITHKMAPNLNHHYGSPYIQIDWANYYMSSKRGISDYVCLNSKDSINLDNFICYKKPLPEISRFYYYGMKSNNLKSKYFNLFLILEFLEYSDRYKQLFSGKAMFSAQEQEKIIELANSMKDSVKNDTLKGILSRTQKPRAQKLLEILYDIGIPTVDFFEETSTPLTIEIVRKLIKTRNILFHQGETIDENIIWGTLIPLTRTIVDKIISNPRLLSSKP